MVFKGFWEKLSKPIIGLSPMDGITDAAFRYIIAKHGNPDVMYTEFVNVEGLARGATKMLNHFIYEKSEHPIMGQIYGNETESFYKVALMVCYLGFDGIDINMGCPATKVARRNSGAGLIRVPDQAKKIIQTVKKAAQDWSEGITLEEADLRPKIINALKEMRPTAGTRNKIPVSVKTRTGIDSIIATDWVKVLLEEEPAVITMHGRTLKQMYTGEANWEVLGKVAAIVKQTNTLFFGNGDVKTLEDAKAKIKTYGTDGVLVGRATCGNPWFFTGHEPTPRERANVAIEHCRYYERVVKGTAFYSLRSQLGWYIKGFDGAKDLRIRLMLSQTTEEVERIFEHFFELNPN